MEESSGLSGAVAKAATNAQGCAATCWLLCLLQLSRYGLHPSIASLPQRLPLAHLPAASPQVE